jgi:hypothetical protein
MEILRVHYTWMVGYICRRYSFQINGKVISKNS